MSTVAQKPITADEFFRMPEPVDGSKQELVQGEIVTMPPTGYRHGDVQGLIYLKLKLFLMNNPVGNVIVESGVRMVWIADPEDQTVTIYRRPGEGRVLSDDAEITGEDVLPGFRCKIGEFFK